MLVFTFQVGPSSPQLWSKKNYPRFMRGKYSINDHVKEPLNSHTYKSSLFQYEVGKMARKMQINDYWQRGWGHNRSMRTLICPGHDDSNQGSLAMGAGLWSVSSKTAHQIDTIGE